MRRSTLSAAAIVAAALALPATAAAEVTQDFDLSASPAKASTAKKKVPVTLNFRTGTKDSTGAQPPTTTRAVISFPAGSVWNGGLFPRCAASKIAAAKSTADCPKGSIVGSGKANGLAPGPLTQSDLKITVANGGPSGLSLFVEGRSPLRIQSNIFAKLTKASGAYGLKLSVPIPQNLQEPAPGVPVAITLFQVKVGAKTKQSGKTRGLIEVNSCSGSWKAKGDFTYRTGAPISATDSQRCSK